MWITDYQEMVEGEVTAPAVAGTMSLSFWGGVNVKTGQIEDIHHDLCGENVTGKILCIPSDRGSCSGSGVLLEMVCNGTSPAGLLCVEAEPVLALGPMIGEKVFGKSMPVRTVSKEVLEQIKTGDVITFAKDAIVIEKKN